MESYPSGEGVGSGKEVVAVLPDTWRDAASNLMQFQTPEASTSSALPAQSRESGVKLNGSCSSSEPPDHVHARSPDIPSSAFEQHTGTLVEAPPQTSSPTEVLRQLPSVQAQTVLEQEQPSLTSARRELPDPVEGGDEASLLSDGSGILATHTSGCLHVVADGRETLPSPTHSQPPRTAPPETLADLDGTTGASTLDECLQTSLESDTQCGEPAQGCGLTETVPINSGASKPLDGFSDSALGVTAEGWADEGTSAKVESTEASEGREDAASNQGGDSWAATFRVISGTSRRKTKRRTLVAPRCHDAYEQLASASA